MTHFSVDKEGNKHKGKGKGGGQFTGKSGESSSPINQIKQLATPSGFSSSNPEHRQAYNKQVVEKARQIGVLHNYEDFNRVTNGKNVGGEGHDVFQEANSGRYYKFTKGGVYGQSRDLPGYLESIGAANELWPQLQTKFEGVTLNPSTGEPQVVTSVEDMGNEEPTQSQVSKWLLENGWVPDQEDWDPEDNSWINSEYEEEHPEVWINRKTGTKLHDVHSGNWRITPNGLVGIDLHIVPGKPQKKSKAPVKRKQKRSIEEQLAEMEEWRRSQQAKPPTDTTSLSTATLYPLEILNACLAEAGDDVGAGLRAAVYILSTDATGLEHRPKGTSEGGQFTGKKKKFANGSESFFGVKPDPTGHLTSGGTENVLDRIKKIQAAMSDPESVPIREVPSTVKFIPIQSNLSECAVEDIAATGHDQTPILAKHEGGYSILDGHHHLAAQLNKDDKNIKARVIDLGAVALSINAYFAHDVANRHAQGVLNRSLKAAKGLTEATRTDLETALKRGATDGGQAILEFIDKYRLQLAKLLTTTQLSSLLEGAREVAAKVPALEEDADALGPTAQPTFPIEDGIHLVATEAAVKELAEKNVLTRQGYDALDAAARAKAFTVAGVDASDTLEKIRDVLAENVREGADYETFKQKVMDAVDEGTFLSEPHMETVFRTNVQSAFSDGQMAVLQNPLVQSGFPYSAYDSIHDDRVRAEHLSLDKHGIDGSNVYRTNDPVFQTFRPPWDYNCRCSWTPMTVRQASEAGIEEAQTWLETGVEPSPPAFVAMPPFEPPAGFQRALSGAPLSIRLSLQPIATFTVKEVNNKRRAKKRWVTSIPLSTGNDGNGHNDEPDERVTLIAEILVALFRNNALNVAKKLSRKGTGDGAAFAFNTATVQGHAPGTLWSGPRPPAATGWVQTSPGPRGGLRWVRAPGAGSTPPVPPTPGVATPPAPTPTPAGAPPAASGGRAARLAAATALHTAAMAKLTAGQALTQSEKSQLGAALRNMSVPQLRSLHTALGGTGIIGGGWHPISVAIQGLLRGTPAAATPPPPPTPPTTAPPVPPTPTTVHNFAISTLNSGQPLGPTTKSHLLTNLSLMSDAQLQSLYTALGGNSGVILNGGNIQLQNSLSYLLSTPTPPPWYTGNGPVAPTAPVTPPTPPTPPAPVTPPAPSPLHRGANVITGTPARTTPAPIPIAPPNTPDEVWETGKPKPGSLNGVAFTSAPHHFWEKVADVDLKEPPTNANVTRAGILIQEPDGRVWIVQPTNGFGGRKHTLPGGTLEPGLSVQQNALKEVWEETGLQVEITGYAGDFNDSNYPAGRPGERFGRLYIGKRIGGAPWDAKVESHIINRKTNKPDAESEAIKLVTPDSAAKLLHRSDDLAQLMVVRPIPIDNPVKGAGSEPIKKLLQAIQPAAKKYKEDKEAKGQAFGNAEMHAVQELRGFNGKPKVVPQADFDALMAQGGHIEVLRGVATTGYGSSAITGDQLAEQFRNGDHFPGHGIFGSGTYVDSNKANSPRGNVASQYANQNYGSGGAIIRMALPKTAKIIKESELERLVPQNPDAFKKYPRGKEARECWLGMQAALAGYDAIECDGASQRHGSYGKGFYVVLNRSTLTVQDKSPPRGYQIP